MLFASGASRGAIADHLSRRSNAFYGCRHPGAFPNLAAFLHLTTTSTGLAACLLRLTSFVLYLQAR